MILLRILTGLCFLILGVSSSIPCLLISKSCMRYTFTDSLCYASIFLGSIQSSLFLKPFGHKKCIILSNVQCLAGQLAVLYGENLWLPYERTILLGLGIGSSIGPGLAYIGEVCEPMYRSSSVSLMHMVKNMSHMTLYIAIYYQPIHDYVAIASLMFPLLSIAFISTVPDSPVWLLAKGETEKARRSLYMLRGDVPEKLCENELYEMAKFTSVVPDASVHVNIREHDHNPVNVADISNNEHTSSFWKELLDLKSPRPYLLILFHFMFVNLSLKTLHDLSSCHWSSLFLFINKELPMGVNSLILPLLGDNLYLVFIADKSDKRYFTFYASLTCTIFFIFYVFYGLCSPDILIWKYFAMFVDVVFPILLSGLDTIGWILVTEIFTTKFRNIACCIYPALNIIISYNRNLNFFYYLMHEAYTSLFEINITISILEIIYLFWYLPQTENKTLYEISMLFKDNHKTKYFSSVNDIVIVGDRQI